MWNRHISSGLTQKALRTSGAILEVKDPKLKAIWRKANPPVVFRRDSSNPLLVRVPFSDDNYSWLRGDKRHKPKWNNQFKKGLGSGLEKSVKGATFAAPPHS